MLNNVLNLRYLFTGQLFFLNNNVDTFRGTKTLNVSNTGNNRFKKNYAGFRKSNETEFRPISSKNNLLKINYELKINKSRLNNKSMSLQSISKDINIKMETNHKPQKNLTYLRNCSRKTNHNNKRVAFKFYQQETESISKDLNEYSMDSYTEISSQITNKEEKIKTINDIYTENDSEIRRKIKFSVQKERLIKLYKTQNQMIESYKKKLNEKSVNNDIKEKDDHKDLKKIFDLNNTIYNQILDYFYLGEDTEIMGEKKTLNKGEYKTEKIVSFSIKSSYSNLNHMTKGKIIINNNYKIDIKNLIQNYIKQRNKNSTTSLDYLVKKYCDDYQDQLQTTFNNINNETPKRRKKVKFKISYSSRNFNAHKDNNDSHFQSNYQIKKTITNKKKSYKNFKHFDLDDKFYQMKLKNKNATNNSSSKYFSRENSLENKNSNSANGFTKFINSIFSKLKGKYYYNIFRKNNF